MSNEDKVSETEQKADMIKFLVVIGVITVVLGLGTYIFQNRGPEVPAVSVQTDANGQKWGLVLPDASLDCKPNYPTATSLVKIPEDKWEDYQPVLAILGCHDATELSLFDDKGVWVTHHEGVITACGPLDVADEQIKIEACMKKSSYTWPEKRCEFHNNLKPFFPELTLVDLPDGNPMDCPKRPKYVAATAP